MFSDFLLVHAHLCLCWLGPAGLTTASSIRDLDIRKPTGNTMRCFVQSPTPHSQGSSWLSSARALVASIVHSLPSTMVCACACVCVCPHVVSILMRLAAKHLRLRRHPYIGRLCTVSSVALAGLKFVVPGWCPGPDDGSLAETNSKCCGQEL